MEHDNVNYTSHLHTLAKLEQTKSALQDATAANSQLQTDVAEFWHNLVAINEIARLSSSHTSQ